MTKKLPCTDLQSLPECAQDFIKLVIKKMRYRKKVRADVMAELTAHFEDELKDCKTAEEKEQKARKLIENFGDAKLLAVLLCRAKKRCRPLWRTVVARTFQTIGVLILCLIVYVVWFLSGKPVITTDYVAELNRIVRPTADESLNAAPLYEKAIKLYSEKTSDEMLKLLGTKYNEATDEQKQLIEKWVNENEEIFELVTAGTNKPYYWPKYEEGDEGQGMIGVLMPHLAEFRKLAYALRWRIWLTAEQGQYKKAFDDIKTCYLLGQHLKGDKFLIDQLVGIAIEAVAVHVLRDILGEHKIDSSMLEALQKDFEQLIADEDFVISFKAEKLFMYDEIQRCFTEDRLGKGHLYIPRLQSLGMFRGFEGFEDKSFFDVSVRIAKILFAHPNKRQTQKSINQFYEYIESLANKTAAQLHTETDVEDNELEQLLGKNIFLEILAPAIRKVIELSSRLSVDVNSNLAIIAILRYQQDSGNYPKNLQELVAASYLHKVPMDPFSDAPLIYKRTEDNFTLYSVGLNFIDDSGEVARAETGGVRVWAEEGDAVFWPVYK